METVIYVTVELGWAMEPWANANEDAPGKPFRTVVTSRGTGIRRDVIITIGAIGGHSDLDADLSLCYGGGSRDADSGNCN